MIQHIFPFHISCSSRSLFAHKRGSPVLAVTDYNPSHLPTGRPDQRRSAGRDLQLNFGDFGVELASWGQLGLRTLVRCTHDGSKMKKTGNMSLQDSDVATCIAKPRTVGTSFAELEPEQHSDPPITEDFLAPLALETWHWGQTLCHGNSATRCV